MSTGKRLAKRSILGTRVCVPGQDGRYYPAVIQALKSGDDGSKENVYAVLFENKTSREFRESEIIGPGFKCVVTLKLLPGQRVFITHNGREVCGTLLSHQSEADEVSIAIPMNGQQIEVMKRLEEIRLLESRKSARLQDQDQDYSRLADFGPSESRKRTTSTGIDVPSGQSHGNRKRRPSSSDDGDVLDDCAAAMVLMSLSCSPKSPRLPGYLGDQGGVYSRSWTESSSTSSSGASSWQGGPRSPNRTSTPSPPHEAAATTAVGGSFTDEGIEMEETLAFFDDTMPRKRRNSTKTVFQCTWPGCKMVTSTCDAVEKHVRTAHLGRGSSDDVDLSDHEEEFYYTEMEVSVDAVADSFASMHTSSPPTLSHMDMARPPYEDPEYQRLLQLPQPTLPPKGSVHSTSSASVQQQCSPPITQQILGGLGKIPMSPQKQMKLGMRISASSPKPSPLRHRKCRKIYGMENRDLWCTQCKWKKACSRFSDTTIQQY